jgi:hypothetical protein
VEGSDLGTKGATKADCSDCSGEGCTVDLAGATWLGREKLELLASGYQAGALGLSLLDILTVGDRVS